MSYTHLATTTQKARKNYPCDACADFSQDWQHYLGLMTIDERSVIERAELKDFEIKKGSQYRKSTGIFDGDFTTFKCIPEVGDIHERIYEYDF